MTAKNPALRQSCGRPGRIHMQRRGAFLQQRRLPSQRGPLTEFSVPLRACRASAVPKPVRIWKLRVQRTSSAFLGAQYLFSRNIQLSDDDLAGLHHLRPSGVGHVISDEFQRPIFRRCQEINTFISVYADFVEVHVLLGPACRPQHTSRIRQARASS